MWIVVDWHYMRVYGPFESQDKAVSWLSGQGISFGNYADQEVSVLALSPITEHLEEI